MKKVILVLTMMAALNSNAGWFSDDEPSSYQKAQWALEDANRASLWESMTDKGICKRKVKDGLVMHEFGKVNSKLSLFKKCMRELENDNNQQNELNIYYNSL